MKPWARRALIAGGSISVALGTVGIFVPILPTTPFYLLAAYCYVRSSEKYYQRLINAPLVGPYIRNYREGRGMTVGAKVFVLAGLWAVILYSSFTVVDPLWGDIVMIAVAVAVTVHLLLIPTCRVARDKDNTAG